MIKKSDLYSLGVRDGICPVVLLHLGRLNGGGKVLEKVEIMGKKLLKIG